jgi:hypothetical protein
LSDTNEQNKKENKNHTATARIMVAGAPLLSIIIIIIIITTLLLVASYSLLLPLLTTTITITLDHIAVQIHNMPQEAYEWVRAWDIQYATELVDWGKGTIRRRPLLPWLDTGGDEELQRVLQAAADEETGNKGEIPIPITRGQVLLLGEGRQARIFVVDGFITLDSPLMLTGMFCTIEADRLQSTE